MRFLKYALAAAALLAASFTALPAQAGSTVLFSSQKGDITFPISPPTTDPAAAGAIDNMIIGGTTPRAGTFTTITGSSVVNTGLSTSTGLQFTGTAPAPTGTGTPTIEATSTDAAGEVTAGASATSVIITFATAKTNAPFCVVTSQTQLAAFAYAISTTAITITQTATSGNKINYVCVQR